MPVEYSSGMNDIRTADPLRRTQKLMALTTAGSLAVLMIIGIAGCTEPRSATEQRVSSPATAQGLSEPAPIGVMDYHSPKSSRCPPNGGAFGSMSTFDIITKGATSDYCL
jgi:hypothetical protein